MSKANQNVWLLIAGLLYSVVTFSVLLSSTTSSMGIFSFSPILFIFLLPALVACSAVVLKVSGAAFHPAALVMFILWIIAVAGMQFLMFAAASASV